MDSTIFACATPIVKSGVAIIRLSGSLSLNTLQLLTKKDSFQPRVATLCALYTPNSNSMIDQGLVLWFPAPNSFTGEDVVELHIHGSIAVIHQFYEALSTLPNHRLAEPGEFSKRAFNNGKMDLTQAEGLADLIDAETSMQAKQALRQSQGELGRLYDSWRSSLIESLASVEAYLDFPDEPLPDTLVNQFSSSIEALQSRIANHLNDNAAGERIRHGLTAIILGEPNVGKSSLLNALAKRDVAIISDIAGTTRDLIEVHLDIEGYPFTIIDTAGIRENPDNIEQIGIQKAAERTKHADIKIFVLDTTTSDNKTLSNLGDINDRSIILLNKTDLSPHSHVNLPMEPIICSMKTNQGISTLIDRLVLHAKDLITPSSAPMITQTRHRQLLTICLEHLNSIQLSNDSDFVIVCEQLRMAANALGRIVGHVDVEEILGHIFSRFCIGK